MNIKLLVKRGTALVLSACFMATAFPPEEVKACGIEAKRFIGKVSSDISYHNTLNKIDRLGVPEKSGTSFGVKTYGTNANTIGSNADETSSVEENETKLKSPEVVKEKDETEEKLEGAYGKPVEVNRNEKVYKVNKKSFVTYLTNDANTYINEDGKEVPVDLNIKEDKGFFKKDYVSNESDVKVTLPEETTEKDGIDVSYKDSSISLIPEDASYKDPVVEKNALLYNTSYDDSDVQYTIKHDGVKEDIILDKWNGKNEYSYLLEADDYDVTLEDNSIFVKKDNKLIYVISAPKMSDAKGEESDGITLSLEETKTGGIFGLFSNKVYRVKLTCDKEWLSSADRAYPVKIDPTVTVPSVNMIEVTTSTTHGAYGGRGYGYAGYITSKMTGIRGARDPGKTRMYFYIDYNFKSIPDEARIDSASLNLYQYVQYANTNATFACYQVNGGWDPSNINWDNSVGLSQEPSGTGFISGAHKGYHSFDIKNAVNNWVQGLANNNGLCVMATDENCYGGAFYTPLSTGSGGQVDFSEDKKPSITINWSVPDPVDMDYPLDNTTSILYPMANTTIEGRMNLMGVLGSGTATPGSMVGYYLNDESKGFEGDVKASYSYKYPNTKDFEGNYPATTRRYREKEGNYQTNGPFSGFDFNTLYNISAQAYKDDTFGRANKSDDFLVYRITQYDTLPQIAAYYGVDLNQIGFDNRIQDMLLVEGNTIFIRNPRKNARIPYNPPALSEAEKRKIDSCLMGRGLHCEFGYEPINLNTGNFYLNDTDVKLKGYTEDFAIERNYNSLSNLNGPFGKGWNTTLSERITQDKDLNIVFQREDGSILKFIKNGNNYISPKGYNLSFTRKIVAKKKYDFNGDGKEEEYPIYNYLIKDNENNVKTFDSMGLLIEKTDSLGLKTQYKYDKKKELTEIITDTKKSIKLSYNDEGKIVSLTRPDNTSIKYSYTNGYLTSVTSPEGNVVKYNYNDSGLMTSWVDENGAKQVENTYDEVGRVVKQADANGNISTLNYYPDRTETIDADGSKKTYFFDKNHRTTKIVYPDGTYSLKTYDSDNNLSSEISRSGKKTTYKYDSNGNLIEETRSDGKKKTQEFNSKNEITKEVDFDGKETLYSYDKFGLSEIKENGKVKKTYKRDAYGRVLESVDERKVKTALTYDNANVSSLKSKGLEMNYSYDSMDRVLLSKTNTGSITKNTYNKDGRLILEDLNGHLTKSTYDKAGNLVAEVDSNGNTTKYSYDKNGNLIAVTDPNGNTEKAEFNCRNQKVGHIDAKGNKVTYNLDFEGLILEEFLGDDRKIIYTYDLDGNKLTETSAEGRIVSYKYDSNGNLLEVSDPEGVKKSYTYDDSDNVTEILYHDGTKETFKYDIDGNVIEKTNRLKITTKYTYDKKGLLIKEETKDKVTKYDYDDNLNLSLIDYGKNTKVRFKSDVLGNVLEKTDANGNITKYSYDRFGNITSETDPEGNEISYKYDALNNLVETKDAAGGISKYFYDKNSNLIRAVDPLGFETRNIYDENDNIKEEIDKNGASIKYETDAFGNIVKKIDKNENVSTYSYDRDGNLLSMTLPNGSVRTYTYGLSGELTSESENGRLLSAYSYDKDYNLISTIDSKGNKDTYTFDALGRKISFTNALGETEKYTYDEFDNLLSTEYPDNTKEENTFDELLNLISTKDRKGSVTKYSYDLNGNQTEVIDPKGRKTKYSYNALNELIKETNAKGEETKFSYDVLGNLTKVSAPVKKKGLLPLKDTEKVLSSAKYDLNGRKISETDAKGNETLYSYDKEDNLLNLINPDKTEESFTYDNDGNNLTHKNEEGNEESYEYDSVGNMLLYKDFKGHETKFEYDIFSNLIKKTDALNRVTSYRYDENSNVIEENNPGGKTLKYTYDALDRITKKIDGSKVENYSYDTNGNIKTTTNEAGAKTDFRYDANGNLLTLKTEGRKALKYSYDKNGNLKDVRLGGRVRESYEVDELNRVKSLKNQDGLKTSYTYDEESNVTKKEIGSHVYNYTYDANGNVTSEVNPLKQKTSYTYDSMDRMTSIKVKDVLKAKYTFTKTGLIKKETDGEKHSTHYKYDKNGNLKEEIDDLGKGQTFKYDKLDRITSVSSKGDGVTESYTYDEAGNVSSVTDGNGSKTLYKYDKDNNLIKEINPLGDIKNYSYDKSGNLTKETLANGKSITYKYDKLGELIKKTTSDKEDTLYSYNDNGERVSMKDALGETHYKYDDSGRIVSVTDSNKNVILYNYDTYGNLAKLIYPDKTYVKYSYDAINRLTKVRDREGKVTTYKYDDYGNMSEVCRPDGSSSKASYDKADNLIRLVNTDKSGNAEEFKYKYDASGNILSETVTSDGKTEVRKYTYNKRSELTSGSFYDKDGHLLREEIYAYDKAGNRISVSRKIKDKTEFEKYTYDKANHLTNVSGTNGDKTYLYDKAGNRIEELDGDLSVKKYSYTAENRLKAVEDKEGLLLSALYDGDGNRVFTAERTRDKRNLKTKSLQKKSSKEIMLLTLKIKKHPKKKSTMEGNLFLFGLAVSALDMFDFAPRAEHPYLHKHFEEMCYDISPKLVKIHYKETDEISGSKADEEKVNLSKKTFIPGSEKEQEYQYLDIKNYVNDVNRENSEVLEVQDENGVEKEGYTYGLNRISAKIGKENITYSYSGRGDVSSIQSASGKKYSYSYDPYGNLLKDDGSAIGALHDKKKSGAFRNSFTYNGEQTDYSTNLQYLRNRYLDTETGTFLTEDTYRGSLTNLKSHNRYSYAENNPVNKIDPSGHKAKSVFAKSARKVARAFGNVAKRIAGVFTSNRAGNHKASRAKSSHSTHKVKTASSKRSGHKAKKSSGGGLVNSFLGFCGKRLNHAKKAIKKAYKKVCTTANRAKKFVANTAKTVTKKAVSVVKSAGKAIVKFKQEHPILTGAIIIGAAAALTIATGGLGTGVLATAISGACTGAFAGSVIGAGAGATFGFVGGLISGKGLKGALNDAAQGFGTGAFSGAISGGIAGGLGVGAGAQRAIRTIGDTLGDLGGRALDGEEITAG
nr:DNRLRE domain-containing protein [Lachnospiraceae bacterium]